MFVRCVDLQLERLGAYWVLRPIWFVIPVDIVMFFFRVSSIFPYFHIIVKSLIKNFPRSLYRFHHLTDRLPERTSSITRWSWSVIYQNIFRLIIFIFFKSSRISWFSSRLGYLLVSRISTAQVTLAVTTLGLFSITTVVIIPVKMIWNSIDWSRLFSFFPLHGVSNRAHHINAYRQDSRVHWSVSRVVTWHQKIIAVITKLQEIMYDIEVSSRSHCGPFRLRLCHVFYVILVSVTRTRLSQSFESLNSQIMTSEMMSQSFRIDWS